jgi:hypothetical protein
MGHRVTVQGLENYFGPIPTAFDVHSPYASDRYYIEPWWVITLNKYQRDNLMQLMYMINSGETFASVFNSGDWVAEFLLALSKPMLSGTRVLPTYKLDEEDHPNVSEEAINDRLVAWLALKIKEVDDIPIREAVSKARKYIDGTKG